MLYDTLVLREADLVGSMTTETIVSRRSCSGRAGITHELCEKVGMTPRVGMDRHLHFESVESAVSLAPLASPEPVNLAHSCLIAMASSGVSRLHVAGSLRRS
jgi:hypothetical protein